MRHRLPVLLAGLLLPLAACGGSGSAGQATPTAEAAASPAPSRAARATTRDRDWPTFGLTASRPNASAAATGITARNVARLRRQTVALPGTVDSSPIYLHDVRVRGATRDVLVMTATYGRTVAVDARRGGILWTFTPRGYGSWAGSFRITQASPTADSDRRHVFSASPDGRIHRLRLRDGREERAGNWPVAVTRDPTHEKLTSSLNLVGDRVVATLGGYIGDIPPYQGHVVSLERATGRIAAVFNALCANRRALQAPASCRSTMAAIWGRSGAVATDDGHLLVSTGNGPYDGRRDFGDSVLQLQADDLALDGHWAPRNQAELEARDADLGSTSPAVLPGGGVLQGGKEGRLVVLRQGALGSGERQSLPTPGGAQMFTSPAVWRHRGRTTVFVATSAGLTAYRWAGGRLRGLWSTRTGGTSPVLAGGLLYVYDPQGGLNVYSPASGRRLATLPAGPGHWNSPVLGGGVVALPEGNGNAHQQRGRLNLYRLG